jgi:GNAT superfamily N-acetyltransferase
MSGVAEAGQTDPSQQAGRRYDLLHFRPIGIDDWSDVRYVHGSAYRTLVQPHGTLHGDASFEAFVNSPAYVDHLRSSNLIGAWLNGVLVGTAGWRPVDEHGRGAEIEALFVQPVFTFMGIGGALLAHVEDEARRAGCSAFTTLATAKSAVFFERFGYRKMGAADGGVFGARAMPLLLMSKDEFAADASTSSLGKTHEHALLGED